MKNIDPPIATDTYSSLDNLKRIPEEVFYGALGALPPRRQTNESFLLGEPYSGRVCFVTNQYAETWHGFIEHPSGMFFETVQPVTDKDFELLVPKAARADVGDIPCIKSPEDSASVFLSVSYEKAIDISEALQGAAGFYETELAHTDSNTVPRRTGMPDMVNTLDRLSSEFPKLPAHSYVFRAGPFSPRDCDAVVEGLVFMSAKHGEVHTIPLAVDIVKAQYAGMLPNSDYANQYVRGLITADSQELESHELIRNQDFREKTQTQCLDAFRNAGLLRAAWKGQLRDDVARNFPPLEPTEDCSLDRPDSSSKSPPSISASRVI